LAGISLSFIPDKSNRSYSIRLGFESIGGGFDSGYYGLGIGYNQGGQIQKYVIDLEFYSWSKKLLQNFFLSPEFEINQTHSQYEIGFSIPDYGLKDNR